jgi:Zn-dependent protease
MPNINDILHQLSIAVFPVILSLTLSEAAYGFMAYRLGDPTPKLMNRLSLDPSKHIDPVWTLVIPFICLLVPGMFLMGGAKQMPINFNNFKAGTIRYSLLKITLAGALSCWAMAFIWAVINLFAPKIFSGTLVNFIAEMSSVAVSINLSFMALRLLPIPGSKSAMAFIGFLPFNAAKNYAALEQYSLYIFLFLVMTGLLSMLMKPLIFLGSIPIVLFINIFG